MEEPEGNDKWNHKRNVCCIRDGEVIAINCTITTAVTTAVTMSVTAFELACITLHPTMVATPSFFSWTLDAGCLQLDTAPTSGGGMASTVGGQVQAGAISGVHLAYCAE